MLKVLIAEDDLLIADMAEEVLTDHGYKVCGIGRNVADSLVLASRYKPDLAILDVRLADGDVGTQIATELADLRELGILYVTANVTAVEQTNVHGHACLEKPYSAGDLLRSLEIVADVIDTGTTARLFPPNFRVLPDGLTLSAEGPDCDRVRLRTLRRQQSVTAEFGGYVLGDADLPTVLTEAVRVCAEGLKAPFCKVYRYRSAQDDLVREAGFGWYASVKENPVLPVDATSPEGRAFLTRQPVIGDAFCEAAGSGGPESNIAHHSVSTVDVIVMGAGGRPYGVLGASNDAQQAYGQNDVEFLSGIANILAGAVANFERTEILNRTIKRLQVAASESNQLSERGHVPGELSPPRAPDTDQAVSAKPGNPIPGAVGKIEIGGGKAKADLIPFTTALHGDPQARTTTYTRSRRILFVEDDTISRDLLAEHFAAEGGFTVFTAGTLAEADKVLSENHYFFDIILLDVGVPDGNGCDYCAKLRLDGHAMPIIMLTGANKEADVVRGLNSGADDYIAKPFKWNELHARLRVHLRMLDSSEASVFAIGPYLFRPAKKLLEDRGRSGQIQLTSTEVAILRFLYHRSPDTVDRQMLTDEVWGHNSRVTTHALDTHIYRLRQKMEANPATPVLLLLERGGYRLSLGMQGSPPRHDNARSNFDSVLTLANR
jgi:DNA-binding response OmpR family regulator